MAKKINNTQNKKIWYFVRVSFFVTLALWVFATFMQKKLSDNAFGVLAIVWVGVTVFNFVNCILHLKKYKEKAFAITSLVVSSFLIFLFALGAVLGALGLM